MSHYSTQPLEDLLDKEDPLEISRYLDEVLHTLVQFSANESHPATLGHRYYLLEALRDTFLKTARFHYYYHGNR